jgi:hypothetical protein
MQFKHGVLAVGFILAAIGSAQAAAIQNGGFDAVVPSNGTGGGWTSVNIDFNGGWRAAPQSNVEDFTNYFIINDAGQPGSDPTLQQLVAGLTVGMTYRITGEYERAFAGFGDGAAPSFGVEIVELGLLQAYGAPVGGGAATFSIEFTAAATEHLLRLTAERNGDDSSYAVDDIAIAAIPEPAGAALLAIGLLAYGGARPAERSLRALLASSATGSVLRLLMRSPGSRAKWLTLVVSGALTGVALALVFSRLASLI